jgi:capsular polysaccharide transport system permease protein
VARPLRQPKAQTGTSVEIAKPTPLMRQLSDSPPLSDGRFIHPLPDRPRQRSWSGTFWFVVCVLLPTLAAAYYYGRVASSRYVSEFRFTVQTSSSQPSSTAAGAGASGSLLSLVGVSNNSPNYNYIVIDYLTSRQAIDALQERIGITQLYSKPTIDWWSRFNESRPIEAFVRYWHGFINAHFDQVTGIAAAQVRAFTPEDSLLGANTLVSLSEELINKIANRTRTDSVKFAQAEVTKAEQRVIAIREKLTEYRNRVGVIDPGNSVVASTANLVQTLRTSLAQLEAQLATLQRQSLLPTAPAIVSLKNQIQSTKEQIASIAREVGKNSEGSPLSKVMGEYEALDQDRQFAQTMLTTALQSLDQARANAAAQHLYITPYVRPALPVSSAYMERYWAIARVAMFAFIFWLIALLIVRSIRERFA